MGNMILAFWLSLVKGFSSRTMQPYFSPLNENPLSSLLICFWVFVQLIHPPAAIRSAVTLLTSASGIVSSPSPDRAEIILLFRSLQLANRRPRLFQFLSAPSPEKRNTRLVSSDRPHHQPLSSAEKCEEHGRRLTEVIRLPVNNLFHIAVIKFPDSERL